MVKRKFWKNSFKSIKDNFSRFLAMFSIVMLSSGVITGLLVTSPNIKKTMQEEYYNKNLADINLMFPEIKTDFPDIGIDFPDIKIGFNEDSIDIIDKEFNEINKDNIMPYKLTFDSFVTNYEVEKEGKKEESIVGHIYEFDQLLENLKINKLELLEGSWPKNENEVLVERSTYKLKDFKPGDKITDSNNQEYLVVGIAKNMWYYSKEAERDLQTGNELEVIIYKYTEEIEYYNNIFITFNKDKHFNLYDKKYNDLLRTRTDHMKDELVVKLEDSMKDELKNNYPFLANYVDEYNNIIQVLDRNTNISFASFKSLINKIETITNLFPIFFLLVSVLVVLTTMGRMIDEERQEVGILRSLGYPKHSIYLKYIIYALLIGVLGSAVGYAIGFRLIPEIVRGALGTIYFMEPLNLDIYSLSNLMYLLFIVLSIVVTAIFAVMKTLRQSSATLLLPKSPKLGKRILLERIPFIWNRLKFKYKSSLRNLFRYPKHFLMTVIGVMGSLALVFTGIGLTSSVDALTKIQYGKLHNFDVKVHLKNEDLAVTEDIKNNYEYSLSIKYFTDILTVSETNEDFYITIIVADNPNAFYKLINRKTQKELLLGDNGVIVTEQIAMYLEKDVGDYITIKNQEIKITGITENYIENYIYISNKQFNDNFDLTESEVNYQINIKKENSDKDFMNDQLLALENVRSVEFVEDEVLSKQRQLNQVTLLAIVIVIAAVFLQVVIIYNLTNVNISEREKELSTLKVLGYKDIEVSNYIYREINIMTGVGMVLGVPLGFALLRFIVLKVDSPNLMMGRSAGWYTYLSSIILTIIMTILVELFMHFKIKKIDMIGALKEL